MQSRLQKTIRKYAIVFAIAVAYLVFVLCTGWGIPCVFYLVTDLQCPACGVSRMLLALLRLDFFAAFHYNPFLFVTAPVLLFCIVYSEVRYVRTGTYATGKLMNVILGLEIGLGLIFGVLRNLPGLLF